MLHQRRMINKLVRNPLWYLHAFPYWISRLYLVVGWMQYVLNYGMFVIFAQRMRVQHNAGLFRLEILICDKLFVVVTRNNNLSIIWLQCHRCRGVSFEIVFLFMFVFWSNISQPKITQIVATHWPGSCAYSMIFKHHRASAARFAIGHGANINHGGRPLALC